MKQALLALGLLIGIFASFVVQAFIPPMDFASGARLLLAPVLFCYGACVLPFPLMLVLALVTGLLMDLGDMQVVGGSVEILPGWSILLLVGLGSICQGLRPLVMRGHWWLPALMSALTCIAIVGVQFLAITMRRFDSGGFFWNETVTWRILTPGIAAFFLSIAFYFFISLILHFAGAGRRPLRDF